MENVVAGRLQSLQFGAVQRYKNIAIVPLIAPDGSFRYRTLGEALAASKITITEVSAAGAVPELLVVNRGQSPVLMIDGEELAGAKQNRVLNTSILLKGLSETRIPVSCTEQGRWSYASSAYCPKTRTSLKVLEFRWVTSQGYSKDAMIAKLSWHIDIQWVTSVSIFHT
jgi:hypothetical protein